MATAVDETTHTTHAHDHALANEFHELNRHKFNISETKHRPPKTADDAIVSALPSDTLRWIKKRRQHNCKMKVAMTHHRETQLRDIFRGLDYTEDGEIDLNNLKSASAYVEESLKGQNGDKLNNLQEMFAAMDDDGNGVVGTINMSTLLYTYVMMRV